MRGEGGQELQEGDEVSLRYASGLIDIVEKGHQGSDRGVELLGFDIFGDLFDGLVHGSLEFPGGRAVREDLCEAGNALKESPAALDGAVAPGSGAGVIAHEQDIDTERVGTVLLDDVQRVDDVALGLGHLVSVRTEDQALGRTLHVGFRGIDLTDVVQEMMPEPGIDQVSGDMLHAAVVPVDRHPVIDLFPVCEDLVIVGIHIAEEIPGGTGPLGHGVGLAFGGAAAFRTGAVDEGIDLCERGLAVFTGLEILYIGKAERQFLVGNTDDTALGAVNERDGLAPVALAVEGPVLHLELDACAADSLLLEDADDLRDGIFFICQSVEIAGIDHLAVAGVGFFGDIAALDDFDDRDSELGGKLPVTLVVGRYGHDRAGAVAHHDIVRDEDRDGLAVHGIDCFQAFDLQTGLVFHKLGPLKLGLLCAFVAVTLDRVHVGDTVSVLVDQRMLGCHDHKGHAEKGVGTGRVDLQLLIDTLERKVDKGAGGLADPVDLLHADVLGIIHCVESGQELVGILGDLQIPDILGKLDDIAVADVALAALAVLVGEDDLAGRAIVDQSLVTEDEAVVEQLAEDPLCPLVIILSGGVDHAVPVKGKADSPELIGKFFDIFICDNAGMGIRLDRIVFGRQAECVETDREQDIVSLHPALSGNNFNARIGFDMADMHACAAGIRKLHQSVKLGLFAEIHSLKKAGIFPFLLPFRLNFLKIVSHSVHPLVLVFCNAVRSIIIPAGTFVK